MTTISKLATTGMALLLSVSCLIAEMPDRKQSSVVSAAPVFAGGAAEGHSVTLSSLKGKPVLLVIAPSPRDKAFRKQISELKGRYERLAAHGMICFAAFTSEGGVVPSNIPFLTVNAPGGVASSYGVNDGFAVVVIGCDGNLDCISAKPLPGQRILDLFNNNASVQDQLRH
jgi:AhpC/TSA family